MIRRSTRVKNPTIKKKEMDLTDAILHFWRIEKSFKSKLNNVITISNIELLKTSVQDSYDEVRRYTSSTISPEITRATDKMLECIRIRRHHFQEGSISFKLSEKELEIKQANFLIHPYASSDRQVKAPNTYKGSLHSVQVPRIGQYPLSCLEATQAAPPSITSHSKILDELRETEQLIAQKDFEREKRQFERIERNEAFARQQAVLQAEKLKQHLAQDKSENDYWSDASSTSKNNDMTTIARLLAESLTISRLPVPEPPVFDGNILQYKKWQLAFDALIGNRNISSSDKIFYLDKYLSGPAKTLVEGTFQFSTEEAYKSARNKLEHRYGNQFRLTEAFLDKINNHPEIRNNDYKSFRSFSDLLNQTVMAMESLPGLEVLNHSRENQILLMKIPEYLLKKWTRVINRYEKDHHCYPPFTTFASFIEEESDVVNNPITCNLFKNSSRLLTPKKSSYVHNTISSATNAIRKDAPNFSHVKFSCLFCKKTNNHKLEDCRNFTAQSPEIKNKFVNEHKLCYGCLQTGHRSRGCVKRLTCRTCKYKHPTSLHGLREALQQKKETISSGTGLNEDAQEAHTFKTEKFEQLEKKEDIYSMTIPVYVSSIQNPSKEILVYALLDTQSDSSFIAKDIADQLNISSETTHLGIYTMNHKSTVECEKYTNCLQVRGVKLSRKIIIPEAYSTDKIPAKRTHIACKQTVKDYQHLSHLEDQMLELQNCEIGLLLGYNCSRATAPLEFINSGKDEPYALKTEIGWCIVGMNSSSQITKMMEADFKDTSPTDKSMSQDDIKFLDIMENNIQKDGEGFYEMPLPLKHIPDKLNNYVAARKRLAGLKNRMNRDVAYHREYTNFMKNLLENKHAEEVEDHKDPKMCWYLPHHGVYHKRKNKLRVVFDGSAVYKGTSLNDFLLTGPDMVNSLPGVLCRFRKEPIAICGDIEQMYYRFRVPETQRDLLRFIWWPDGNTNLEPKIYRMKSHIFGAKSSPACANYGMKKIASDGKDGHNGNAYQFIVNDFYVDDGLTSFKDEDTAIQVMKDACHILKGGNLRLHKFVSNSQRLLESFEDTERQDITTDKDLDISGDGQVERVLGIQWNSESDTFQFSISEVDKPMTRRGVLSIVSSVYDPLGCISPFILLGKQILQDMCRESTDWDEPLYEDTERRWSRWLIELPKLSTLKIDRCFVPAKMFPIVLYELHHFSDASMMAYGQCTYLRAINNHGEVHCSLVFSKARVTPLKYNTIPRLELVAALVSVRVGSMLKKELAYNDINEYYWTDSKVVLGYIYNDAKRFNVFVANRVQQIRNASTPAQWRHVRSKNNPADYTSRGMWVDELKNSNWLDGPDFLWQKELPPEELSSSWETSTCDLELKKTIVHVNQITKSNVSRRLDRFSDWSRSVKAFTTIRRAIRKKLKLYDEKRSILDELKETEVFLIKTDQREHFAAEISSLQSNEPLKKGCDIYNLDPFIDEDGMLRVEGRLKRSTMEFGVKHPILLAKNSHLSMLIIKYCHERACHQGRGFTIGEIRSTGYWIVGVTRLVASFIFRCTQCRRLRSKPQVQKMADLPTDRVEPCAPFTNIAIDVFGPFTVTERRKEIKRYGLLFVCQASRAIHIEVLDDMTTDAFINGLRCFIAIRGTVCMIRCDQGSNFVGASHELKKAFEEINPKKVISTLVEHGCQFIMNSPHSSHMGGTFERQIRTIRNIFNNILFQHGNRMDTSCLRTFMYECMSLVNSRPLTTTHLNDIELDPLTPNHLISMKSKISTPPPGNFVDEDIYARKRWRCVQQLTNIFWTRWRKEYLLELQRRQKWVKPVRNIIDGDVVILKDEDTFRGEWRLGKVVKILGSTDHNRRVKLLMGDRQLANDGRRIMPKIILERPIHKLVLLLENSKV